MKNNRHVKDISLALLIVLALISSLYLVYIGIGVLMVIGLLLPGWAVFMLLIIFLYKRHKNK